MESACPCNKKHDMFSATETATNEWPALSARGIDFAELRS